MVGLLFVVEVLLRLFIEILIGLDEVSHSVEARGGVDLAFLFFQYVLISIKYFVLFFRFRFHLVLGVAVQTEVGGVGRSAFYDRDRLLELELSRRLVFI